MPTDTPVQCYPYAMTVEELKVLLSRVNNPSLYAEARKQLTDDGVNNKVASRKAIYVCWNWLWENHRTLAEEFYSEKTRANMGTDEIEKMVRESGAKEKSWEAIQDWVASHIETPINRIAIDDFPDVRAVGLLATAQSDASMKKEFYKRIDGIKSKKKDVDAHKKSLFDADKRATDELMSEVEAAYGNA